MGTLGGEGLMEVDGAGRLQNPSAETTGLKVDDDGRFLLGPPTLFDLGNERFRCVETGHEMPAKDTESYARSKACRVALIDAALSKNKTPLNMFHQPHPVSKSKLVCKLTGDTINKSEEHIWKHINGKRFLHRLEQKEVEELASRKPLKENMIAVKKDRNKNFDADGSMARKPTSHISASEVPEFLIPPVKSHCDFDDREDRWESCTSSVLETNDDMEIDFKLERVADHFLVGMGRSKVPNELTTNEKSRRASFLKRSKGLKKKAYELHTLCGIDTLLICFGPHDIKPETWPEDPSVIDRIITRYQSLSERDRRRQSHGLAEYFYQDKKKKNNNNNKRLNCEELPSWDDRSNNLSKSSLGELLSIFDMKAEMVRERIELLEKKTQKADKDLMISQPVEFEGIEP